MKGNFARYFASAVVAAAGFSAYGLGERTFREERYSLGDTNVRRLQPIDSASWIWAEHLKDEIDVAPARFLRFRRKFNSPGGIARLDVSADERFVLFVDGRLIGRGPNRGDICNWSYHTYDIDFPKGEHSVEAVVWRIGEDAPLAQLSYRGGFILKADGVFDGLLSTGTAEWEVGELKGTVPDANLPRAGSWGCGSPFRVTGTGFLDEKPTEWRKTVVVRESVRPDEITRYGYGARTPGWRLFPSQLEDQTETAQSPGKFIKQGVIPGTFAPNTKTEVLWDLGDYYTAYPVLITSGGRGAKVRWGWAEGLRRGKLKFKTNNRADWKGAEFDGFTDEFVSDGRTNAVFTTPWFRCGRWVKITVETADEPLRILDNQLVDSRYPLEDKSVFACDDPTFADIRRICRRSMQMCSHEMLYDCPFYEQQMYPGDTRVQLNVLTVMDPDDRLIRRVIDIFDYARRPDGMVPMNYPTRLQQESVTFTMCEIMMFADYARNHDNRQWLKARLPGMRTVLEAVAAYADEDGLLKSLPGWSFIDWIPGWKQGVAPDGEGAIPSALNNLYWVLALMNAAYVERAIGDELHAAVWENMAKKTFASVERLFWDDKRGLYANTPSHDSFCEYAQCLAILNGLLPEERRKALFEKLISDPEIAESTVYSSYYLFETYFMFGRSDLFLKRLNLWRDYLKRDLKTTMERPDDGENGKFESRSDCHAWGAHPLVWMQRGLAGVTSASPFFEKVRVAPCPGSLTRIHSRTPHPKGFVETKMRFASGKVSGTVILPEGITGTFVWEGREYPLASGANELERVLDPSLPEAREPKVFVPKFTGQMSDHTAALQEALDLAAKAGGGIVRVPAGEYCVGSLSIASNVRLELAGGVTDALKGYDDALRRDSADLSKSAVIRPNGKAAVKICLFNFPVPSSIDDGADGVTVSGGVFDCQGKAKFLAFAPGRGIRIENVLVKDLMNDHAIQLDGCEDVVITNCVFAGMDFEPSVKGRNCLVRETVQLEHTGPAALCRPSRSPLACNTGDYRPCRNVTIAGCWFGPGERFGSHLIPIGHHTSIRACEGLEIVGNVFVDSLYSALRIANYVDGLVAGNSFVYTRNVEKLAPDAAVVTFWGDCVLKGGEKGFRFFGNRFETPKDFSLERFNFGNGRAREVAAAFAVTEATEIVVPDPENVGIAAAIAEGARQLQHDIEEGMGLKIPVVTASKASNAGNSIYIGGEFARRVGLMPEGAKRLVEFENVIAVKRGNLYLFGEDKPGHKSKKRLGWTECVIPSLKALTNFMEQDLSIRFLYPGVTGRDVPKVSKVEIPEGTFRRHTPKLNCGNGRYFEMMYCFANNILGAGLYKSYGGHTYPYAVPTEKYFKDHPEYFAYIGKGRQCDVGNPSLCFSNRNVEDLLVEFIAARFDDGYDIVELGQNDGGGYCRCDECATYGGTTDECEQFWIFHKRIAERLFATHPHKTVQIISYGKTYQPPRTFTEFPPNVMIELMKNSPKSLRAWKKYKVPRGFSNYTYNFGTYQLTGYTAHPSIPYVAEDARRIVGYGIRSIYRCGYGEKFGMEGPAGYVFNKMIDDPSLNPDRLVEEFCDRAFGPAAAPMKRFYAALDKKLRGVNKMREGFETPDDSVANIQSQTGNPNELMAYVYSADTMRTMETLLSRAERNANLTQKHRMRLKLVRMEFDYAVKIAKVAHLYGAYRLNPTAEYFRPLGEAIKDRRAYVESLYDEKGRIIKIDGWPELNLFSGARKRTLLANGYLLAILPTPFGWDVDFMNERGILPGSGVRKLSVKRLSAKPSLGDFEGGAWSGVAWNQLEGLQLEKVSNATKFKLGYDSENLYIAVDSTLADNVEIPVFGHDGDVWTTEAVEITIDPFGEREKYYHFIYNPVPKSCYEAAFGFIDWPEDPLYNASDPRWNGKWSYETKRADNRWRSLVAVPFVTLGVSAPEKGVKMCFNIGREGGVYGKKMDRGNPELAIWSPNLEERTFHGRDAMGEITFE